jgi:EamA domain-containing membrane protein RarD
VLLYQIAVATVATPPLVYEFGETAPAHLSAATVASLLWQGVAVVGVSYALWFWTLTNYAAAQLSAFTFITPLVGVFAGWLVFGEKVTAGFALAIALVLAGLALVTWPRGARAAKATNRACYLAPSVASKDASASSIAVLCVAVRGTSVGQTGTVTSPAGVHSARKS